MDEFEESFEWNGSVVGSEEDFYISNERVGGAVDQILGDPSDSKEDLKPPLFDADSLVAPSEIDLDEYTLLREESRSHKACDLELLNPPLTPAQYTAELDSWVFGSSQLVQSVYCESPRADSEEVSTKRIKCYKPRIKGNDQKLEVLMSRPILGRRTGGERLFTQLHCAALAVKELYSERFDGFHLIISKHPSPAVIYTELLRSFHGLTSEMRRGGEALANLAVDLVGRRKRRNAMSICKPRYLQFPERFQCLAHASLKTFRAYLYERTRIHMLDANDNEDEMTHVPELKIKAEEFLTIATAYITLLAVYEKRDRDDYC